MPASNGDSARQQAVVEDRTIRIVDHSEILQLDFAGAKKFHEGDSWWGLAVGFRAMQRGAEVLSRNNLWDRKDLFVVSSHPGPGVRDAIEYVTECVGRKQYRLTDECATQKGCSREMKFEWQISDGEVTAQVKLRTDFVPADFYELLDRLGTDEEQSQDADEFNGYKTELSESLWAEPLSSAFNTEIKHRD